MKRQFAEALLKAQGRSEFVIVVVADIRGFSRFSTRNESPNIAMFIKRFYLRLMNEYFQAASFVKPTGDGLLMTFTYTEDSLLATAKDVIEACLRCLTDFPTLCKDDPMINFSLPNSIGFGIARGTACCLYSGQETLDYSGHLLNLASRLNDLARPSGIVIDGAFLESVIPETLRSNFKTQLVYVRSIAEETAIPVFYLDQYVRIPEAALVPLTGENWRSIIQEFSNGRLQKLSDRFRVNLPSAPKAKEHIRVVMIYPTPGLRRVSAFVHFSHFEYRDEGLQHVIILHLDKARSILDGDSVSRRAKVRFRIEYVPKPLPRS